MEGPWRSARIALGLEGYIRGILGLYQGYIRVILGLYWGYIGVMWGLPGFLPGILLEGLFGNSGLGSQLEGLRC